MNTITPAGVKYHKDSGSRTCVVVDGTALEIVDGETQQCKRKQAVEARQVAFVKNLVDGMTITEAARSAGYSKNCPGQSGYQALGCGHGVRRAE